MFLKVVAIIDIILGIILMIFNPDQISTLFVSICASVAMIYFADMFRDVAKIRFEAEQIHHELVRASKARATATISKACQTLHRNRAKKKRSMTVSTAPAPVTRPSSRPSETNNKRHTGRHGRVRIAPVPRPGPLLVASYAPDDNELCVRRSTFVDA